MSKTSRQVRVKASQKTGGIDNEMSVVDEEEYINPSSNDILLNEYDDTKSEISEITNPDEDDDRNRGAVPSEDDRSISSNGSNSSKMIVTQPQMHGLEVSLRICLGVAIFTLGFATAFFPPTIVFSPFIIPATSYIGGKITMNALNNYIEYHPDSILSKVMRKINNEDIKIVQEGVQIGVESALGVSTKTRAQGQRVGKRLLKHVTKRRKGGPKQTKDDKVPTEAKETREKVKKFNSQDNNDMSISVSTQESTNDASLPSDVQISTPSKVDGSNPMPLTNIVQEGVQIGAESDLVVLSPKTRANGRRVGTSLLQHVTKPHKDNQKQNKGDNVPTEAKKTRKKVQKFNSQYNTLTRKEVFESGSEVVNKGITIQSTTIDSKPILHKQGHNNTKFRPTL